MLNRQCNKINQSMECCKLIAAVFVVFIHISLPGTLGLVLECLARFAVPVFFAISGYFSYQIDSDHLRRRILRFVKLNLTATGIYFLWGCWKIGYIWRGDVVAFILSEITASNLAKWFLMNINPFSDHLWYLSAILMCYITLWLYVSFFGQKGVCYKSLYIVSIFMFLFSIIFGVNIAAVDIEVPYIIYRNFLFFGLPMFSMGLFIHEYQEELFLNFRLNEKKEILMVVIGILLSLLQWYGIGKVEMPIGTIIEVIGLMLLMISHPIISKSLQDRFNIFGTLRKISLTIYIMHPLYKEIVQKYSNKCYMFSRILENTYSFPFVIIGVSIISGIIFDRLSNWMKH